MAMSVSEHMDTGNVACKYSMFQFQKISYSLKFKARCNIYIFNSGGNKQLKILKKFSDLNINSLKEFSKCASFL